MPAALTRLVRASEHGFREKHLSGSDTTPRLEHARRRVPWRRARALFAEIAEERRRERWQQGRRERREHPRRSELERDAGPPFARAARDSLEARLFPAKPPCVAYEL